MRNPYFLPSGFETQEKINILEAARESKNRLDKIKERKREDRIRTNLQKHCAPQLAIICNKRKHSEKSTKEGQIQQGYDLATEWGWDGIDRPYVPKIMSVMGGRKRKKTGAKHA